ncbi:unnamed protein product [Kuraishia capsulata CBS 1993]|uniref:AAA+ ATPase domain-containing protein n=1 Tax=Kuraishia capsulata CBS 1993 TaxID=1382522 RepID=W6MK31_9ASCO|nr:uncharacterized protein KUCA_T00000904001 [Kuraishia capsulata CBS 1993]CDK24937.1 unnamed protein product [Kuraishia capsulata CBS 1993]
MAPKSTLNTPTKKSSSSSGLGTPSGLEKKSKPFANEFILRPSVTNKGSLKHLAFFEVSPAAMQGLQLTPKSFVRLSRLASMNDDHLVGMIRPIETDEANDSFRDRIIYVSPSFLKWWNAQTSGNKLCFGERLKITQLADHLKFAKHASISHDGSRTNKELLRQLNDIGVLYPGMVLSSQGMKVDRVWSSDLSIEDLSLEESLEKTPCIFNEKLTTVSYTVEEIKDTKLELAFDQLGGIARQLELLNSSISIPLYSPDSFAQYGITPSRGLIIHGPSGTGKTTILKGVSEYFGTENTHVLKIDYGSIVSKYLGDTELKLKEIFKEAMTFQPSVVMIDELETLTGGNDDRDGEQQADLSVPQLTSTLTMIFDSFHDSDRVVVVSATNDLTKVDSKLRRMGRFDREVEISIPDQQARFEILQMLVGRMGKMCDLKSEEIEILSNKTHGYVGSDLVGLCRESVFNVISHEAGRHVQMSDFEESLKTIKPSVMKDIFLELPKVKWSDIGGQEVIKRKLQEMVALPLIATDTFSRLGIKAPRGMLLYGPPGCSKTLIAKALAHESGLNFLAVKGPEIFNKYVGESERTIREIFRKAKNASPSIIFFDEIDALASTRDDGASGSHNNVLTSLLNEIDGVEELKGVMILGATNRPTAIDPALLRPGRLDRHLYVAPPDRSARLKILENQCRSFQMTQESLERLADQTEGCSGAEVVLLCQEAGLGAIMEDNHCDKVDVGHFQKALQDLQRGITQDMLEYYEDFEKQSLGQ